MNSLKASFLNLYKKIVSFVIRIINFGEPELIRGPGAVRNIPEYIKERGWRRPLIVTDGGIIRIGLMDEMLGELDRAGMTYTVYDGVAADPPTTIVEQAARTGIDGGCDCVIGFGGGSSLDTAKMAAVKMGRPETDILALEGILKVKKPVLPVIAIPTTSGTGSECTAVAVITNPEDSSKHAIGSPRLIPEVAVLDPLLTGGLPSSITAETGMDALTHAVESYISIIPTEFTDDYARRAVSLIFENLEPCADGRGDEEAREKMMIASYYAGAAFTRAMLGYAHAIAHGLGAYYHLPHGLANAIALPHVLEASLEGCADRLAELADLIGLKVPEGQSKARAFIGEIRRLKESVGIPDAAAVLEAKDIRPLAEGACAEAISLHAPPVWFSREEVEGILRGMLA